VLTIQGGLRQHARVPDDVAIAACTLVGVVR